MLLNFVSNFSWLLQLISRQEIGTAPINFQKGKIQENKNWKEHDF